MKVRIGNLAEISFFPSRYEVLKTSFETTGFNLNCLFLDFAFSLPCVERYGFNAISLVFSWKITSTGDGVDWLKKRYESNAVAAQTYQAYVWCMKAIQLSFIAVAVAVAVYLSRNPITTRNRNLRQKYELSDDIQRNEGGQNFWLHFT